MTKSLLILDSDADVAGVIAHEAENLGFAVKIFDDAQLFIDEFLISNPSYLAIDLAMPVIDGVEVLLQLVKLHCKAGIILTNGIATPLLPAVQMIASENQLQVTGVLHRPIEAQALRSLLSDKLSEPAPHVNTGEQFVVDAASLDQAMQNKQFVLHYQPQIDLPSGKVTGLEGLLRWCHPTFGMKFPASFIPVAEKTGQINQLMQLTITNAFDFLRKLTPDLSFSLNVSTRNIQDPGFIDMLNNACQTFGILPQRVVLEFAGPTSIINLTQLENPLKQLNSQGFRLGMDDFGAAYSPADQLARLPFSELKIDKSLVASMAHSSKSRKTIASTIKLAEKLGLTTVAEGIENDMEAIGLRELGCQSGQGYYFARPMNREATMAWLQRWNYQLHNADIRQRPSEERMSIF